MATRGRLMIDGGMFVALKYLLTPFYVGCFAAKEGEGTIIHYRIGYVFGIRIFKIQFLITYEE